MEEKILVQSIHYNIKKFSKIVSIIAIVISVLWLIFMAIDKYSFYSEFYHDGTFSSLCKHTKSESYKLYGQTYRIPAAAETREEFEAIHPNVISYIKCERGSGLISHVEVLSSMIPLSGIIIAIFLYLWLSKYELIVTDKRVYGKAAFGKRVDLPLDSISAVGTSWLKGVDVGTSSGRIHFKLVKNQDEVHSVMSKLLMERQQPEAANNIKENPVIATSNADELKKFKELLDSGVITQEEFDAKKKQLLGL